MATIRRGGRVEDWDVVQQFLPKGWQDAARQHGALQRARGIADAGMLLRILMVHLVDGCSLKEAAIRVREAGWCRISPVALHKRLQAAEQWLRWLAEQLWRSEKQPGRWGGFRVRAVDATTVVEAGRTGSTWRAHYALNLSDLQCDFFELTGTDGGETFRRIPVRVGDLVLGDRAYGTPPGVVHVTQAGGAVLVRINLRMLPLFTRGGRRISVLQRLRALRIGEIGDWCAFVQGAHGRRVQGRLIAIKRSRRATQLVRKRLRRKANRQQRTVSPATLAAARYLILWTSVPAAQLPAAQALEFYRLRWQIELAFKRMKSIMGFGQIPKRSDSSARAWLHGKLFVALLLERIVEAATAFSPWGYPLGSPPQPMARNPVPPS